MADLVAVMDGGRIAQSAPPGDLYNAPADLGVATFVGEAVVLDVVAAGASAESALGPLTLRHPAAPGPGRVVVRPEQITVGRPGDGVPARVTGTVFYGHDALVRLELDGYAGIPVAARQQGAPQAVAVGDSVAVQVVGPVSFYPAP